MRQTGSKDVVCHALTPAISCAVRTSQEPPQDLSPRVDGPQQRSGLPVPGRQAGIAGVTPTLAPGGLGSDPSSATSQMYNLERFH